MELDGQSRNLRGPPLLVAPSTEPFLDELPAKVLYTSADARLYRARSRWDMMDIVEARNTSKNGAIIARRILWAGTSKQRRRGLLGRDQLDPDEGIYIAPCECVHTFGMRFAIDVAFLAPDGRVLAVNRGLKPRRLSKLIWKADGVLELAAGRLEATGTEVGDMIEFRDPAKASQDPAPC